MVAAATIRVADAAAVLTPPKARRRLSHSFADVRTGVKGWLEDPNAFSNRLGGCDRLRILMAGAGSRGSRIWVG